MNAFVTLCAGLALTGTALSLTGSQTAEECPVSKEVNALIVSWDAAAEQAKTVAPEQQRAIGEQMAAVAEKCPVGSRIGGALSAVDNALAIVVSSEQACAADCPLDKLDDGSEAFVQAQELKAAHNSLIADLKLLSSHAAGATCDPTAAKALAEGGTKADDASCEVAAHANCPIRVASQLGMMKAEYAVAQVEAKAMSAEAKAALMNDFAALGEAGMPTELVPASVMALNDGLAALAQIDAEMMSWGEANPEIMAQMMAEAPESAQQSYMMQTALLDEAHGLLTSMTDAMQILQPQVSEAAAPAGAGTR